jgi:hypothetical protein
MTSFTRANHFPGFPDSSPTSAKSRPPIISSAQCRAHCRRLAYHIGLAGAIGCRAAPPCRRPTRLQIDCFCISGPCNSSPLDHNLPSCG